MTSVAPIIFLPATATGPAEPAPYLMTEAEAARFLRIDSAAPSLAFARYRRKGWLRGVQVGKSIRYALPDLMAFLEKAKEENPR